MYTSIPGLSHRTLLLYVSQIYCFDKVDDVVFYKVLKCNVRIVFSAIEWFRNSYLKWVKLYVYCSCTISREI